MGTSLRNCEKQPFQDCSNTNFGIQVLSFLFEIQAAWNKAVRLKMFFDGHCGKSNLAAVCVCVCVCVFSCLCVRVGLRMKLGVCPWDPSVCEVDAHVMCADV